MKKYSIQVGCFLLLLIAASCSSQKKATKGATTGPPPEEEMPIVEIEERQLDTLVISAPKEKQAADVATPENYELPPYNASYTRRNDLLHTNLDLRFNWKKEEVIGKAILRFQPLFYPVDEVVLDAKDFELHEVRLENAPDPLKYDYDGQRITIQLDRTYRRGEEYNLFIDYTAHPSETGGSAAITSDRGLFFIKPDADNPSKPMQIWTQGETEWNSRWFPTIDKPNERTTQEVRLTVKDEYETLSNGLLISSERNADGTRTDHWKMDLPHAPYLFMIAVGDFAIVRDQWEDIPVAYYVEKEFEQDARAIFPYTVEMLDFFSEKLQLKYPWPKYDQIVVRDYVSGAMENTSAVIFGEFMQKDRRELIDELMNEKIVAHEMFHHWFGDLVTCESWANLTMNEGFANYSEYLWLEHKYGAEEADYHLLTEWGGYLAEARRSAHPLINFGYANKENMFNAHSYNKGGAVLHMLRHYVGDEAFWAALHRYLSDNAYTAVEAHDLRLAFEEVTGEDLNWFFNQWYFNQGHPQLNVTYGYNPQKGQATMTVEQTQDPNSAPPIFQLPATVAIYVEEGAAPERHPVRVTERRQTFTFDVPAAPKAMVFDADHALLAEVQDNRGREEMLFLFDHSSEFIDRFNAIQNLRGSSAPAVEQMLKKALKDKSWVIRSIALNNLDPTGDDTVLATIRQIAADDPHSQVRGSALYTLADLNDPAAIDIAKNAIENDSAYTVAAAGLDLLTQMDRAAALEYARKLEDSRSGAILEAIGGLYAESGDPSYLDFFENNIDQVDGFDVISHVSNYKDLAVKGDMETIQQAVSKLEKLGSDMGQSPWRRLAAMNGLNDIRNHLRGEANRLDDEAAKKIREDLVGQISEIMETISGQENIDQLKEMYKQLQLINKA